MAIETDLFEKARRHERLEQLKAAREQDLLPYFREVDGEHSHPGEAGSINAWVRVYEEDALEAAARADERLSDAAMGRDGPAPPLTGVPIGLKDLYGVAGKPVTASSGFFEEVPTQDCDAWARLSDAGMVLLGHLHTHEFAVGGTTDQVGSPWDLRRSPGGSLPQTWRLQPPERPPQRKPWPVRVTFCTRRACWLHGPLGACNVRPACPAQVCTAAASTSATSTTCTTKGAPVSKFLSEEWMTEATKVREEFAGKGGPPPHEIRMNLVITEVPADVRRQHGERGKEGRTRRRAERRGRAPAPVREREASEEDRGGDEVQPSVSTRRAR